MTRWRVLRTGLALIPLASTVPAAEPVLLYDLPPCCPAPIRPGMPVPPPVGTWQPPPQQQPRPEDKGKQPEDKGQTRPEGSQQTPSDSSTQPSTDSSNTGANNTGSNDFSSAPQAGAEGGTSFAPNMFGDAFGGASGAIIQRQLVVPGKPGVNVNFPGSPISGLFNAIAPGFGTGSGSGFGSGIITFASQNPFARFGTTFPAGTTYNSAIPVPTYLTNSFTFTTQSSPIPVAQSPAESAAALRFAQATFGPGGTLTYLQALSQATLVNAAQPFNGGNPTSVGGGLLHTSPTIHPADVPPGSYSTYNVDTEYNYVVPPTPPKVIPQAPIILNIPNPAEGGVVGRTKISDDNSPLPRDRFIVDYDDFNNVPLTNNGVTVHRFNLGIEKTFLDQSASIELRVPFAATISPTVQENGLSTDKVELGNLNLTLKALIYTSRTINVATGLGIALPTADDTRVVSADGTDLVRIRNEAVILTPYLAALFTPTDRFFAQTWVEFGFDANGNPVDTNLNMTGLKEVGRLRDMPLAQFDAQLGYWLYRSNERDSTLRGLAPFIEVHYDSTLGGLNMVDSGNFMIGDLNHLDEVNLSAGAIFQIGNNFNLVVGAVVPLRGSPNRTFDYQVGVHGTIFFGPTARSRSSAAEISTF